MRTLSTAIALLFAGQLLAIEPRCVRVNDLYAVNFTAYHVPSREALQKMSPAERKAAMQPHCQSVPQTGKIYFGVDLLDRDARQMPVWMRLVRLQENEEGELVEGPVIARSEPQIHPQGSLQLAAQIDEPGRYLVIVTFGKEATIPEDELKIPITIGQSASWEDKFLSSLPWLFGGIVLLSLAGAVGAWWRRRHFS